MHLSDPKIAVVLSTYNGAKYIAEQLNSISNQLLRPTWVIIRDDGSTDNTCETIKGFFHQDNTSLTLIEGNNLGPTKSFIECLKFIPKEADYVAFADQDDVWNYKKLKKAVDCLEKYSSFNEPLLYCSEYYYCDELLNIKSKSDLNKTGVNFSKILFENPCSGNTMVFNRRLLELSSKAKPEFIYSHDWWFALLACGLGKLVYDDWPCLKYRRTGCNVSPSGDRGLTLLKKRFKTFFANGELTLIKAQINEFKRSYYRLLSSENKQTLNELTGKSTFSRIFFPKRLRQKISDEFILRVLFLLRLL